MKRKKIAIATIMIMTFSICTNLNAQPPNPPGDPVASGDPVGGGAPLGSGVFILLALGAAYGGKKIYELRKERLEE
jgi:hypothetical protein